MAEKPLVTRESLRLLIDGEEGQFLELKGCWSYRDEPPTPVGKKDLRAKVAEYVAAFANADGGTLVIGVEDDGTATGHNRSGEEISALLAVPRDRLSPPLDCDHQILELDGQDVLVIEVGRTPRAVMVNGDGFPYRTGGRVIAESEEWINELKSEYRQRGFEQRIADAAPDDIDLALLPAAAADPAWLERRGLVIPRRGTPAVANAAVLLAGRQPTVRWHPNFGIRIFRVDGTERRHGAERNVIQVARIDAPIAELIPAAYEVLRGQIRRSERLHSLFFREAPEYPTFAWQEAVVNAVAHRDYADQGRGVEVWLYDDRMEVISPGLPIAPLTVDDLRNRSGIHATRNPLIVRVLVEAGLMRDEGEGIERMYDVMERSLLRPPSFEVRSTATLAVVLRNTPVFEADDGSWGHLVDRVTENPAHRRALLAYPEGFTNEQYRQVNGVDRDEAYRQIQELVAAGVVLAADRSGRGAIYRLSPDVMEARAWLDRRLPEVRRRLSEHGSLTNSDYRQLFGVTRSVALAELHRLVDEGFLAARGVRRGAHYVAGPRLAQG